MSRRIRDDRDANRSVGIQYSLPVWSGGDILKVFSGHHLIFAVRQIL